MIVLGIMGVVVLQLIGIVWSLATIRRWFRNSSADRRPRGWVQVGWHVVLPLVVNLFLGFAITVGFPAVLGVSLRGLMFVYPDLGYAMALSSVVAFGWIMRTVLAYFALRATSPSANHLVGAPVSEVL